jgi:hypothetical protein
MAFIKKNFPYIMLAIALIGLVLQYSAYRKSAG